MDDVDVVLEAFFLALENNTVRVVGVASHLPQRLENVQGA